MIDEAIAETGWRRQDAGGEGDCGLRAFAVAAQNAGVDLHLDNVRAQMEQLGYDPSGTTWVTEMELRELAQLNEVTLVVEHSEHGRQVIGSFGDDVVVLGNDADRHFVAMVRSDQVNTVTGGMVLDGHSVFRAACAAGVDDNTARWCQETADEVWACFGRGLKAGLVFGGHFTNALLKAAAGKPASFYSALRAIANKSLTPKQEGWRKQLVEWLDAWAEGSPAIRWPPEVAKLVALIGSPSIPRRAKAPDRQPGRVCGCEYDRPANGARTLRLLKSCAGGVTSARA